MDSKNRSVALVTGGSRGIGRGIAEILSLHGFDIVIAGSSSADAGKDVVEQCTRNGAQAFYIKGDISITGDRLKIADEIRNKFGRIDLLVNNAGVAPKERIDILKASEESYDRVMNINIKGPYFLTQIISNWMIELQKQLGSGYNPKIINIGSLSSYASSPARGEYCISKAGVSMMTSLYADRLSEYGINVYEIRPGIIATDMTDKVKDKYDAMIAGGITPIKRWGKPEDIAKAVLAVAQDFFPFSTGEIINVDGGFHIWRL